MIVSRGELGRPVATRHGFAEAEIGCEHAHATRELCGPEAHELLEKPATRVELADSASFDRVFYSRKHCDERHTLRDDDQSDDQREKSVAVAPHHYGLEYGTCMVRSACTQALEVRCGIEMKRTAGTRWQSRQPVFVAIVSTLFTVFGPVRPIPAATLSVVVVNQDGRPIPGAVVTAELEADRALTPAPPQKTIIDQVDLAFVPDVSVVPVGSPVSFPNSDKVSHQVYSFSPARRSPAAAVSRAAIPAGGVRSAGHRHARLQHPRQHARLRGRDGCAVFRAYGCERRVGRARCQARCVSHQAMASVTEGTHEDDRAHRATRCGEQRASR